MKYYFLCFFVCFIGCGAGSTNKDELVLQSIKNPTPLQRVCKNYIYQTPPVVQAPIAEYVSLGDEASLCVALLAGEDTNQKNNEGKSLLQIANEMNGNSQQARMIEILTAAGAA